jgi:hypothetical protein
MNILDKKDMIREKVELRITPVQEDILVTVEDIMTLDCLRVETILFVLMTKFPPN